MALTQFIKAAYAKTLNNVNNVKVTLPPSVCGTIVSD